VPAIPGQSPTPVGPDWLHEIKHDGFRILAARAAAGVRLYSRNGHDFTKRFPLIVAAVATLQDLIAGAGAGCSHRR
jgi:bifunctional non-homologous end joining protein LigD